MGVRYAATSAAGRWSGSSPGSATSAAWSCAMSGTRSITSALSTWVVSSSCSGRLYEMTSSHRSRSSIIALASAESRRVSSLLCRLLWREPEWQLVGRLPNQLAHPVHEPDAAVLRGAR